MLLGSSSRFGCAWPDFFDKLCFHTNLDVFIGFHWFEETGGCEDVPESCPKQLDVTGAGKVIL